MIKYVNGGEVSRNDSTDDFIDYVRPTARKKNLIW